MGSAHMVSEKRVVGTGSIERRKLTPTCSTQARACQIIVLGYSTSILSATCSLLHKVLFFIIYVSLALLASF